MPAPGAIGKWFIYEAKRPQSMNVAPKWLGCTPQIWHLAVTITNRCCNSIGLHGLPPMFQTFELRWHTGKSQRLSPTGVDRLRQPTLPLLLHSFYTSGLWSGQTSTDNFILPLYCTRLHTCSSHWSCCWTTYGLPRYTANEWLVVCVALLAQSRDVIGCFSAREGTRSGVGWCYWTLCIHYALCAFQTNLHLTSQTSWNF